MTFSLPWPSLLLKLTNISLLPDASINVHFSIVLEIPIHLKLLYVRAILDLPPSGVEWPSGTFGIPRPRFGCPRSKNVTWSTGWRFQDTEDENPNNYHSPNFHMNSSVMKNDVNRTFCTATENNGTKPWPKGKALDSQFQVREHVFQ